MKARMIAKGRNDWLVENSPPSFETEEFEVFPAELVVRDPELVPEATGAVYALLLRGASAILNASGYFELGGEAPATIGGFVHVYTGSTYEPRRRLKHHLLGGLASSTLRKTLLAIDHYCLGAEERIIGCDDPWDEAKLTKWIVSNALVAFRLADHPAVTETLLLNQLASPLNITNRRSSDFARRLTALRCMFDGKPIPRCCAAAARNWIS